MACRTTAGCLIVPPTAARQLLALYAQSRVVEPADSFGARIAATRTRIFSASTTDETRRSVERSQADSRRALAGDGRRESLDRAKLAAAGEEA